ncbi:MAG: Asp-tRNA(Asn)/Glu-tRNA(Gln) amidotransferase subunit GatC [Chlorobi bacterium]|nr:Asp-tRNA(Asn)/Glu-tRNA(Gln) amidotransferase subunit GatC [Chlorobiota bacterium]
MSVTREDVSYIAGLARLQFSDEEMVTMTTELNSILHYVEKLNAFDTEGVVPLSGIHDQTNVLREDVARGSISTELALQNAPDRQDRFFRVPKVLG